VNMKLSRRRVLAVAVVAAAFSSAPSLFAPSFARASSDAVAPLLELIAQRLALMPDVAKHKFNSGAAVEDLPREAQVLAQVTAAAEAAGLPRAFAQRFFQAQIDAARLLQQSRIDGWKAQGQGKFANVPDLSTEIRPMLDGLTPRLIAALQKAYPVLKSSAARERIAAYPSLYSRSNAADATAALRAALAPLSAP
jgi:chorismate mutase